MQYHHCLLGGRWQALQCSRGWWVTGRVGKGSLNHRSSWGVPKPQWVEATLWRLMGASGHRPVCLYPQLFPGLPFPPFGSGLKHLVLGRFSWISQSTFSVFLHLIFFKLSNSLHTLVTFYHLFFYYLTPFHYVMLYYYTFIHFKDFLCLLYSPL